MSRPSLQITRKCDAKEEMGETLLCLTIYFSIAAIFWKGSFLFIFCEMSLLRCAIWLCIYCKKVRDVHLPIFIIVVSDSPCNFRDMAPPALSEWTPTRSGFIPDLLSCNVSTAVLILEIMCFGVIWIHELLKGS